MIAPGWLIAAIAVALPIVLHLRARTPPQVIRVGSIADLTGSGSAAHRRRIRDVPLLLVRCAVVALLALLLARPAIDRVALSARRIAVVPRGHEATADSMRNAGARVELSRYASPWIAAALADRDASDHDTLMLALPADAPYPGIRPRVRHPARSIGVPDTLSAGAPAAAERTPQQDATTAALKPPRHRADLQQLVLVAIVAALLIERWLALRSSRDG